MAPRDVRPAKGVFNIPGQSASALYSHASSSDGSNRLVFTAGHWGLRNDKFAPTLKQQVADSFLNLEESLRESGASPKDIVKLTFYVVDWPWAETDALVEPWMQLLSDATSGRHKPPSVLVPVPKLAHPEAKFEVEAVASIPGLSQPFDYAQRRSVQTTHATHVDVVVVGAGFSGTQAANDLSKAGLSVALLEATHRVGGRSKTINLSSGKGKVELGATWINQYTQPKIYATAKRLGLHMIKQYLEGDGLLQTLDGRTYRFGPNDPAGSSPGLSKRDFESVGALIEAIDYQTTKNPQLDINDTTLYPTVEDVSALDWVKQNNFGDFACQVIRSISTAMVGREPHEIGIHYLLDYIKSGGGFKSLTTDDEHGSQYQFIQEGTSAIAHGLAAELKPGSVIVNCPVDEIDQCGSEVVVTTATGLKFRAKKIIVAVPTNTYGRIHFNPPLPAAKRAIISETKPGVYAKVLLTYSNPWWRDAGLSGKFRSQIGPICFSWEVSNFEDKSFTLALFIAGDRAAKWYSLSKMARQHNVIEHLATMVGEEYAKQARDVLEYNAGEWTEEEWFGGAPTSAVPPHLLSQYGEAMRAPFKNTHFAGGETAREWKGYLEGALRAGTRAADEVLIALGKNATTKL